MFIKLRVKKVNTPLNAPLCSAPSGYLFHSLALLAGEQNERILITWRWHHEYILRNGRRPVKVKVFQLGSLRVNKDIKPADVINYGKTYQLARTVERKYFLYLMILRYKCASIAVCIQCIEISIQIGWELCVRSMALWDRIYLNHDICVSVQLIFDFNTDKWVNQALS